MWMMTKIGFYSIVEKGGMICVRARKQQDIKNFRKHIPNCSTFIKTPHADYRYRVFMKKEDFEKEFYRLAQLVDYGNFKDEVYKTNPDRERLYHRVWAELLAIEKEGIGNDEYYYQDIMSQLKSDDQLLG